MKAINITMNTHYFEKQSIQTPFNILFWAIGLYFSLCSYRSLGAEGFFGEAPGGTSLGGFVTDMHTGKPIEYAQITLHFASDSSMVCGSITGNGGQFTIASVNPGHYYLMIQFIGYKKKIIEDIHINRKDAGINFENIPLEISPEVLEGFTVTERQSGLMFTTDKQVIVASEVMNNGDGTASGLLQNSPSVTVDHDNQVYLRGSNSFLLLIEGKPVNMAPSDALQQIPSSNVEKIEIITNPSARYDAEGTAGIVNIILKKNRKSGTSGQTNLRVATFDKYHLDGTVSTGLKRVKASVNAGAHTTPNRMENTSERTWFDGESLWKVRNEGHNQRDRYGYFARGTIDWRPDLTTTLSLDGNLSFFGFQRDQYMFYTETPGYTPSLQYSVSQDLFSLEGLNKGVVLSYNKELDTTEHNIRVRFSFHRWEGINTDLTQRHSSDPDQRLFEILSERKYDETNWQNDIRTNADYVHQMKKIRLETGLQMHLRPTECLYTTAARPSPGTEWEIDSLYSGGHTFQQDKITAYGVLSGAMKGFTFQAGLRTEFYSREFQMISSGEVFDYQKLLLFPSVHLSTGNPQKYQLQISYTRRVNYPNDWSLSPTPMFSDGYNIQLGNPLLNPELIHQAELNQMRYFGQQLVALSLYFRHHTDHISRRLQMISPTTLLTQFANLPCAMYYGAEGSVNLTIARKYRLNGTINWFHQTVGSFDPEDPTQYHMKSFYTRLMSVIPLTNTLRGNLSFNYNGAIRDGQAIRNAFFTLNAGIRKELINRKLAITIQFNDLLNSMDFLYTFDNGNLQSTMLWKPEYPTLSFSVSYSFNDFKQNRTNDIPTGQPIDMGL
jgi:hypothetical protein